LYHTGVCKALNDNNLLPRVLSGSSVGSIIVAIIGAFSTCLNLLSFEDNTGTRNDHELKSIFERGGIQLNFFPTNEGSVRRKLSRLVSQGVLLDIAILENCVRANVRNFTFQEAYQYRQSNR